MEDEVKKLQDEFKEQSGENWINSQDEPDIDYVHFLEMRIISLNKLLDTVATALEKQKR